MTPTKVERQILENQIKLMQVIRDISEDDYWKEELEDKIDETDELLSQKKSEEPCCEMPNEKQIVLKNLHEEFERADEETKKNMIESGLFVKSKDNEVKE